MTYRVALLPGDGVGPEVIAEARRAVDALGLPLEWTELPWGSAYWHEHGRMMPEDWESTVRAHDAILMGAVGDPSVPDHLSLWGLILLIRQRLDLWANIRPARLLEGIPCPLGAAAGRRTSTCSSSARTPKASTRASAGARTRASRPRSGSRRASSRAASVERVLRHAFAIAAERRGVLTSATKSNASRFGYVLWDEVAEEVAADFPGVRYERVLVDALAARMVRNPESLDVVVGSNLFADILTDLAAAIQGGMGMAASANTAPGADAPGLFEPVHGSAPDIAGQGIGNPAGAIWSASLMLDYLGEAGGGGEADARAGGRVPRRPAHARHRRSGVDARGRRGRHRTTPITALPRTTSTPAATRRRLIISWCRPNSDAENTTAHSDCVAFSGATIDTRPWSNATSRKM